MVAGAAWSLFPLLPISIRGLRLWATLIPFLLSVLEKIKIYNPLPHPTRLRGTDCIRRRNGNGELEAKGRLGSCWETEHLGSALTMAAKGQGRQGRPSPTNLQPSRCSISGPLSHPPLCMTWALATTILKGQLGASWETEQEKDQERKKGREGG